jgi:hypothetical protein
MSAAWHWNRLRAMQPAEVALHVRKKLRQRSDSKGFPPWPGLELKSSGVFPKLPDPASVPSMLREHLVADAVRIRKGQWRAFGRLPIQVDDPPRWQKDYLAGKDLETSESAFKLNYRTIRDGADSKLIWEASRWFELVRLAQAAYVLQDNTSAHKCLDWLSDWVEKNPPFRGWNWVSALESAMRLIQFTWIDALLSSAHSLQSLRARILPPHVWHTWRYRSFGSSANNHLLGELSGLIVALVRWPDLERVGPKLADVQELWEREVLAQFAGDGGNREQALNYHLYSWEFCWQAQMALRVSGREVDSEVNERLCRAEVFFMSVQVPSETWDYGDSDDAFVTPLFANSPQEWWSWFNDSASSPAIAFWCGLGPKLKLPAENEWIYFPETGIARLRGADWDLRWDLSPLGYQSIAAHGHLDALHLSMWFKGIAILIDPGTGAYFADPKLRTDLAGWDAHNGPHLAGCDYPRRLGTFLWNGHHAKPVWKASGDLEATGELRLREGVLRRRVAPVADGKGWLVEDSCEGASSAMVVRWQFPPGATVQETAARRWRVQRESIKFDIQMDGKKAQAALGEATVAPAFRQTTRAPYLEFRANAGKACVLRTIFLAC